MKRNNILISDVDRHRFDADPEPTFYFDPSDPSLSFTHVGNQKKFFDFYSQQRQCRKLYIVF
jgi:hypothetical protein